MEKQQRGVELLQLNIELTKSYIALVDRGFFKNVVVKCLSGFFIEIEQEVVGEDSEALDGELLGELVIAMILLQLPQHIIAQNREKPLLRDQVKQQFRGLSVLLRELNIQL